MGEKTVHLKDGTAVLIRPMREDDFERSWRFFQQLPDEDRRFLRVDVTRRENVERRIRMISSGNVKRLIAIAEDEIAADGALELAGYEWAAHVAEIRLIVARPFRRKGLGALMAGELYALAAGHKIEQLVVEMMRPQQAARSIFRKLGFREELILSDHLKDRHGERQDLILMRCNLEALWQELESFFSHSDWQPDRY